MREREPPPLDGDPSLHLLRSKRPFGRLERGRWSFRAPSSSPNFLSFPWFYFLHQNFQEAARGFLAWGKREKSLGFGVFLGSGRVLGKWESLSSLLDEREAAFKAIG